MEKTAAACLALLLMCSATAAQSDGPHLWPKHAEVGRLPFLAAKAMIPGTVVVRCHLNNDGTVLFTEVVSGHGLLGEASADNSFNWVFFVKKSKRAPFVDLTYEYRIVEGGRTNVATAVLDLPHRVMVYIQSGEDPRK